MKKERRIGSMALLPIVLTVGLALGNMHCGMLGNMDCGVFGNGDCGSSSGTFTTTGSMTTARADHTATLLPGGKVLIVGGAGNSGEWLTSAELYDPDAGAFTATGSMTTAQGTATLLPSGKVLLAGGAPAELYDPVAGTFAATGSMTTVRGNYTATLLRGGKVLIAGGDGGGFTNPALASAELYDPVTGTFAVTGSMATGRRWNTATLLPSGKVLIAGGAGTSGLDDSLASGELYDPVSGTFTTTGSLTTSRYAHTATLLPDGKVLIAGGQNNGSVLASAELYR